MTTENDPNCSSMRIEKFCMRNGPMSRCKYHDLKRKGKGPKEFRLDGLILISIEAEKEWRARHQNPTEAEAARNEQKRDAQLRQSREAAAKSVSKRKNPKEPTDPKKPNGPKAKG
jgi:hypothetical protein